MTLRDYWTDDFNEFRKKLEMTFGSPEAILEQARDVYPHLVMSHGFMEYAGVRSIHDRIANRVAQESGVSFRYSNPEHEKLYHQYLKEEFVKWVKANKLEESLIEEGWKEYLED